MKHKHFKHLMLTVVLVSIIVIGGFSVKDAAAAGETVTVTFWKAPHSAKEAELWKPLIADFEAQHPNIKIEHVITPWDTWGEKYTSGFASGSPPCVSYMVDWWSAKYAYADQFVDLDEAGYSTEVREAYSDAMWSIPNINGHQYGIPYATDPRMWLYNKDHFDAAGLEYPTDDWTWDDFMKYAKALTTKDHYGYILDVTFAGRGYTEYLPWFWNAGAKVLNEDMTQAVVNSPEAVKAMAFVINLFKEGVVPAMGQYTILAGEDLFMRGGVSMANMRGLTLAQIRDEFSDLNYGVVRPPKGPVGQTNFADWGFYALADRCPQKEEAWEWLKYITSREVTEQYLGATGLFPARGGTELFGGDEDRLRYLDSLQYSTNIPIHPQNEEMYQTWWTYVEAAVQGAMSAQDASDEAAEAVNDVLE